MILSSLDYNLSSIDKKYEMQNTQFDALQKQIQLEKIDVLKKHIGECFEYTDKQNYIVYAKIVDVCWTGSFDVLIINYREKKFERKYIYPNSNIFENSRYLNENDFKKGAIKLVNNTVKNIIDELTPFCIDVKNEKWLVDYINNIIKNILDV